ncbi:MAG: thioredoxin domain-containing protein [Planctomycetia bacterium]|nr:thioredoxin domain-containing protein [Planctomycetia bacterium]
MTAPEKPGAGGPLPATRPGNRLADSTSPYLLQHAGNPVHWEPWGREAIARAIREDRPIFLSVGYSACHWCHVMAHECFENEAIAAALNASFVSIKVDREERPDLDAVYMTAVQLLTGRGGWPMSVFLTPGLEPFFAGTYWPPEPRGGMPGFPQVLAAVAEAWTGRRATVERQAAELTAAVRGSAMAASAAEAMDSGPPSAAMLDAAAETLGRLYDPRHGGFGGPPKFPHPLDLRLLLRTFSRSGRGRDLEMATHSLASMAAGGIHDQLGGGFSRYSVDERWLVPHFEKMLYDNALLSTAYLDAFLVTGRTEFAGVVRSTLDYLLRDMVDPAGGLWSAEDADSEGEEGLFYLWNPEEIAAVLGREEAALFCDVYDVTAAGNFEGRSILHLARPTAAVARERGLDPADLGRRLAAARAKLLEARNARVRPGIDDKVLVAWNGLAIDALARAAAALGEDRYRAAAVRAADFLLRECRDERGRLAHQWRRGRASGLAFAEDLGCLADGLVSLYEATFDERWIDDACRLADQLLGDAGRDPVGGVAVDGSPSRGDRAGGFVDPPTGGFRQTSSDHERLLVERPDLLDTATPSATGMAATVLLRLAAFTGRDRYRTAAGRALAAVAPIAARSPTGVSQSLLAADLWLGPLEEDVIVGDMAHGPTAAVVGALRRRFRPRTLTMLRSPATAPPRDDRPPRPLDVHFVGRPGRPDDVTLYACSGGVCRLPAAGADAIAAAELPERPISSRDDGGRSSVGIER